MLITVGRVMKRMKSCTAERMALRRVIAEYLVVSSDAAKPSMTQMTATMGSSESSITVGFVSLRFPELLSFSTA